MAYCPGRSTCSSRSCSPDPWGALRHGIRPKVHPMIAYNLLSMDCAYTGAFAPYYYTFYFSPRETRVKRTQLLDVATSHAPLIKIFQFVLEGSMDLPSCFYHCRRDGTEIKYSNVFHFEFLRLIKTMFPHVLFCSSCRCVCSLEAISLGAFLGGSVEENKNVLFFRRLDFYNLFAGWIQRIYTPCGSGPGGFSLTIPAEGCLFHLFEVSRANFCDPGIPQGPLRTLGARRNYTNS